MERQIRLLVVDDHRLVAQGLARLLADDSGITVVGVARDGEEAVDLALRHRPDVILMDLVMPRWNGVDATRKILARLPNVKVIVSAEDDDERQFVAAVRAGAYGFVNKSAGLETLLKCIRGAAAGEPAISRANVRVLLSHLGRGSGEPFVDRAVCPLTAREREVLALLVDGKTYGAIAAELCISEHTVRTHVQNMQGKLGLANRAQLIGYAIANRVLEPEAPNLEEPPPVEPPRAIASRTISFRPVSFRSALSLLRGGPAVAAVMALAALGWAGGYLA